MDESAQTPPNDDLERARTAHLERITANEHEVEDDGPDPVLDPTIDAQIRAMLASAPDPGPMPDRFADRIDRAIAEEDSLRVDRGPLLRTERDDAVLTPLIRQRQRPRPLFAAAAVAAAAAVVAVGGSALHLNKRPNGAAVLGDASSVVTSPSAPTVTPTVGPGGSSTSQASPTNPNLHIQLSSTDYTSTTLPVLARAMLTRPDAPLQELAAEAPTLGPIGTEIGLATCLAALSVPTDVPVFADLATFEGQPVAVIVASGASGTRAYVVQRSCTTGNPAVIKDATPVP